MTDENTGTETTQAVVDPPQGGSAPETPDDKDWSQQVEVPDSPADKPKEPTPQQTAEEREAKQRAAYEQVRGTKPAEAAKPAQPQPPAPRSAATAEEREVELAARRALRRDQYTDEEIAEMPREKMLALGKRRADHQARIDAEFAKKSPGKTTPEAADTKADEDGGDAGATKAYEPPPEVLNVLEPEEAKKLTDSVTRYTRAQTNAHARQLKENGEKLLQAQADVLEARCLYVQRELAATFPALKDNPPQEFLERFQKKLASGEYDHESLDGVRELMKDTAFVVYGEQIRQDMQRSAIERNKAALNGQPDPKTLSAQPGRATVTREEFDRLAIDAIHAHPNNPIQQKAWLDERIRGRKVV